MSAIARPPAPARDTTPRVVAVIAGTLIALIAFGLLAAGGVGLWADATQRDAGGYLSSPWHRFDTSTRALTVEGVDLGGPSDWLPDFGAVRVRARASDGGPVFVGIAPEPRVDGYLRGVAHTEVTDVRTHGYRGNDRAGVRVPSDPAGVAWSASATGD